MQTLALTPQALWAKALATLSEAERRTLCGRGFSREVIGLAGGRVNVGMVVVRRIGDVLPSGLRPLGHLTFLCSCKEK